MAHAHGGSAAPSPLQRLCLALAGTTDSAGLFEVVAQALADAGCARNAVLSHDAANGTRCRAARGLSAAGRAALERVAPWTAGAPTPLPPVVVEVDGEPALAALVRDGVRTIACVPVATAERRFGLLALCSDEPRAWRVAGLELAHTAAALLAALLARDERQQRAADARQLECLGVLAGGVAHDFNNVLTAIVGYAAMLRSETVRGTPARAHAEQLVRAVDDAAELTRQLLAFARPDHGQHELVDLDELATEARAGCERLCGDRVLVVDAAPGPLAVFGDRALLHQLLLVLVAAARAATPPGGTVTVRLRAVASGRMVELAVADGGDGCDDAARRRLFEPTFRSGPDGCGTELGLATCLAIVAAAGGELVAAGAPGRGTTFVATLPVAPPGELPPARAVFPPLARVLLVDDTETVRAISYRALVGMGLDVATANDGRQALALLEQQCFDIVVSDVVMPQLGGVELTRIVAARWPEVRVLLMTGFVDDSQDVPADVPVLRKPFLPRELELRIRELLRARR